MPTRRHPIVEEDLKTIVSSPLPWDRLSGKTFLIYRRQWIRTRIYA